MPTLKQMRNRMLGVHTRILQCLVAGKPIAHSSASPGELRGLRKAVSTLRSWGAIDHNSNVTDTGRALLENNRGG